MQESANLLESIIRKILLSEQDNKEEKIKKLKADWANATHEEQEDRLYIEYTSLENPNWKWDKQKQDWVPKDQDDSENDSDTNDSDENQTPDESWLGRPVPPPDQYTGKNGNASKQDLKMVTLKAGRSNRPVKIVLRADAIDAFQRVQKDMGAMGHTFLSEMKQVYSFRTYKSAYNLIDWDHWKKTGKWQTIDQNGKVYPAAKPGTSAHGIGLAMDFSSTNNINMMKEFGPKHGWIQNVPNDDPHFRYFPDRDKGK